MRKGKSWRFGITKTFVVEIVLGIGSHIDSSDYLGTHYVDWPGLKLCLHLCLWSARIRGVYQNTQYVCLLLRQSV